MFSFFMSSFNFVFFFLLFCFILFFFFFFFLLSDENDVFRCVFILARNSLPEGTTNWSCAVAYHDFYFVSNEACIFIRCETLPFAATVCFIGRTTTRRIRSRRFELVSTIISWTVSLRSVAKIKVKKRKRERGERERGGELKQKTKILTDFPNLDRNRDWINYVCEKAFITNRFHTKYR